MTRTGIMLLAASLFASACSFGSSLTETQYSAVRSVPPAAAVAALGHASCDLQNSIDGTCFDADNDDAIQEIKDSHEAFLSAIADDPCAPESPDADDSATVRDAARRAVDSMESVPELASEVEDLRQALRDADTCSG